MTNPKHNPSGTDSVSSQELKEWHAAGDGVPLQYKGREHVWNKKVARFAAGGEVYNTVPDMKDGGDIIQGPAYAKGGAVKQAVKGAIEGVVEGIQKILPRAEADANKAKFLAESKDQRRFYHGNQADIERFIPSRKGVFVSPDPEFASKFSEGATGRHGPNVMPVRVQVKNPFDYDNPAHMKAIREAAKKRYPGNRNIQYELDAIGGVDDSGGLHNNWASVEHPEVQRLIQQLEHDAYYTSEGGTKNLGIYNPNQIKSDIGNTGAYDVTKGDIKEAHGGAIHMGKGGKVKDIVKSALTSVAEAAGMKAPVTAAKDLTTLQDFHTSLGDKVRERATKAQDMMDSWNYKYGPGQHVFTEHGASKNLPPLRILERSRSGNQVIRGDHPTLGPGLGKPMKDPQTGETMRTPYEPGYRVRRQHSNEPDDYAEFIIPESAIKGDVEMSKGGKVKDIVKEGLEKLLGKADEAPKGVESIVVKEKPAKAAKPVNYSPKVLESTAARFADKIAAANPKLSDEEVAKKAMTQATKKLEWERTQKPALEKRYGDLVKSSYSESNAAKQQNTPAVVQERMRKANEFLDQPTEPWTPPKPELQAFDRALIKDALEGFPGVEQSKFPRDIPSRANIEHVEGLYTDPANRALIEKQIKRGLPLGGESFYASLYPVKQAVLEAGMPPEKFEKWIHSLAPASARNSIMNEMAAGQFLRDMNARGIPLTEENVAREMALYKEKFGIGLPLMPLHREGVAKVLEGGQNLRDMSLANIPTNYKIPTYGSQKAGDFANSVVLDVHEAGGQTQGSQFHPYFNEQGGFGNTEYNAGEQGMLGIAKDLGIPGGMAQAGRWFGGGELTGLKSPRGDALDLLEKQVAYTLKQKGIQPNPANVRAEILNQIKTGEGDLLPWYRSEGMPDVRETGLQRAEGGDVHMAMGGEVHMGEGGDPRGEMRAYDPTTRERMALAIQEGLERFGANRYKARRNAETITGGPSSALPMNMGAADFVPFLGTGLGVEEGARDLGQASDAFKRGDYIDAAVDTAGAAMGLIPGASGTIRGGLKAVELAKRAPEALSSVRGGLETMSANAQRPFRPATLTMEAVAPDLGQKGGDKFKDLVTKRMIFGEGAPVGMERMGGRKTEKTMGQGLYENFAGQQETNPMVGVTIPRAGNLSTNKRLIADIGTAGRELNQEMVAAHKFTPLMFKNPKDATAMMIGGSKPLTKEQILDLSNMLPGMIVTHSPKNNAMFVAPFEGDALDYKKAAQAASEILGKGAKVQFGKADSTKDIMFRGDYEKMGARPPSAESTEMRKRLKKAEERIVRGPSVSQSGRQSQPATLTSTVR